MDEFDVAIVGLGPVGAAGALLLAEAGLKVAAVERDRDIHPLPRAVGMDGEVVRAFQSIDRGEELNSLLQTIRPGERAGFANAEHEWMFGQDLVPFGPHGWAPFAMFHQPELDGWLRNEATRHGNVTPFIGYSLEALSDDANSAALTIKETKTGEALELSARYVIGCDGAASFVRQSIGAGQKNLGYDQDWLVIDVEMKEGALLPAEVLQVCDPARITTYVAAKDPFRRWEFRLNPGETREEMLKEERIHELIAPWTDRNTYDITRAAVYQFHALVADNWQKGRILLAGDAAHQTPPFLGQGMNAGMRDVINLAWKLPRVLSGQSPERLLDSYSAERSAHSEDLIDWAVKLGQLMEFLAAADAAAKGDGPPPGEPPEMSAAYGQGRMIPPLRHGVLMPEQTGETGFTGYQLDQPMVKTKAGETFRLDDLMGPGFAIVGRSDADLVLGHEASKIADRLGIRSLSLEGLEPVKWHFDPLFETRAAALIRPDRYIFGHTDENLSLDDLVLTLADMLGLDERTF